MAVLRSRHARGLVREDGKYVREIADASEEEKEHGDPLGGFAAVVEEELGDAGGEVEDGAEVAEGLAEGGEAGALGGGPFGWRGARGTCGGDPPSQDAGDADKEDAEEIEEEGLERGYGLGVLDRGGIVGFGGVEKWDYWGKMLGRDAAAASFVAGEETCGFGGLRCTCCDGGVGRFWRRWWWFDFVAPGESLVVEALTQKDDISYGIVDGENYLGVLVWGKCGVICCEGDLPW